ncbi:hypothetical protein KP79_PYT11744 [Mizuhopecten yessoensis]|uniref:Major facilitator superfamily (MFS) profile domain-containing protein n=1 Tax=Mizuhopecten yessoensis TaxID=6573 RepID=A0A210PHX4_MIZYE|nr:hypothetical protein KP79_PYT11744 [Mizuhopecten yessoensis]
MTNAIQSSENIGDTKASDIDLVVPDDTTWSDGTSLLTFLITLDFQLLTLIFTLTSAVGQVFLITLLQTTAASGMDSQNALIVLIIPIINAVISAAIGIISDHFHQRVPRMCLLTMGTVAFIICQGLVIGLGDKYQALVTASLINGVGQSIIWSISPVVMSEMFSIKNLGRNWGIALLMSSLVGCAALEFFLRRDDIHPWGSVLLWNEVCS